jgi:putative Mn2+ efflux pump MntP
MNLFFILPVALALSMDAFAVSIGVSVGKQQVSRYHVIRLASSFGIFQCLMPMLGWLVGQSVLNIIRTVDHWVAFGLLFFVGLKMICESFTPKEKSASPGRDPTKGIILIVLSIATSIDALAVGLSFAVLKQSVLFPAIIIGAVAFLMTVTGAKIGPLLGKKAGKKAELIGGIILILIGAKILSDHLG